MKVYFIAIVITVLSVNISEGKKIAGYLITKSNDTVKVTFNIMFSYGSPDFESLQWKVKYYDSLGIKHVILPGMANEIFFSYKGQAYKMLSRLNNLITGPLFTDDTYVFLHLIKDGKVKLFKYYQSSGSGGGVYNGATGVITYGGGYSVEKYVLQKGNNSLVKTRLLYFKKDISNYLVDCPDLVKQISDDIYSSDDLEIIIDEYNKNCK